MEREQVASIDFEKLLYSNLKVVLFLVLYVIASSLFFYYMHGLVSAPLCECSIPLTWIAAMMSTSGIIVGIAVYFYMKRTVMPETVSPEQVQQTTRFLPTDQREIIEAIISSDGEISQSDLPGETGLSKVKVSRKLKDLERQRIISREENGMTNKVRLRDKFEEILL